MRELLKLTLSNPSLPHYDLSQLLPMISFSPSQNVTHTHVTQALQKKSWNVIQSSKASTSRLSQRNGPPREDFTVSINSILD